MRPALIASCILVLPALLYPKTDNWAESELEKSRGELADIRASIDEDKDRVLKNLKDKFRDLERESRNYREQIQKSSDARSLFQTSKFYDSMCDEMHADLGSLASCFSVNLGISHSKLSLSELRKEIEKTIGTASDVLFHPLVLRDCDAVDSKSGLPLHGKSFRVGGMSFFIGDADAGFLSHKGELYGKKYGTKIRAFADSKTPYIPVDVSKGRLIEVEKNSRSFVETIKLGGVWMYPILFFGAISTAVILFKIACFITIPRSATDVVTEIINALSRGDDTVSLTIARSTRWPYSSLLSELVLSRKLDSSMLEEVSYEYMLTSGEKIFSGLSILSVSAAVSPLFGLLGTVTGIIKTFGDLSFNGAAQTQFISAGISEALITTEYGLIVAILAFVAHALLSRRAKAVMSDMEKLASAFLSGISKEKNG